MSVNIINGDLSTVKTNVKYLMILTSTGKEISTGVQILNGSLADIKTQVKLVLPLTSTGNSLA